MVTLNRFIALTMVGAPAGIVGGYIPATIAHNLAMGLVSDTIVFFASAGAILAIIQRASGRGVLPRWWPLLSAAGWVGAITMASGARGMENNDLRIAIPAGIAFSLVVGAALLLRRGLPVPEQPKPPAARAPSRFSGFRTGALAVPAYLIFVGLGHLALAPIMSSRVTGPRDGQAFSSTFFLGLVFVVLGLFAVPVALGRERTLGALARAALVGLLLAVAVTGYTASRGYDVGGVAGQRQCIVEQGREICPPGDGTYIKDARPDLLVMWLAAVGAYAIAHLLGRRAAMPLAVIAGLLLASCGGGASIAPGPTPFGSADLMERSLSQNACRALRDPAAATLTPDHARFGLNGPNTAFGLAIVLDVAADDAFRVLLLDPPRVDAVVRVRTDAQTARYDPGNTLPRLQVRSGDLVMLEFRLAPVDASGAYVLARLDPNLIGVKVPPCPR